MKTGSINLSRIPKEKLVKGKNGDLYLPIAVWVNTEPDKYGNHEAIMIQKSKEEKEAGEKSIYIGNLKDWSKQEQPVTDEDTEALPF